MANDNKLSCEEESCKTDNSAPLYIHNECDPQRIQILLHALQPEPRAFPHRAAQPAEPSLIAPRNQNPEAEAYSSRRAIQNVPDSSRSALVVTAAACRYTSHSNTSKHPDCLSSTHSTASERPSAPPYTPRFPHLLRCPSGARLRRGRNFAPAATTAKDDPTARPILVHVDFVLSG